MNTYRLTPFRLPAATLSHDDFVARFSAIYEHSPWVAEKLWDAAIGPMANFVEPVHSKMIEIVNNSDYNLRQALIMAHPDLAGKAAAQGELTADSTEEQSRAGLDQCTEEELARFTRLNDAYKARFGFPFIMAVRNSNRHAILAAFEERLENTPDAEFQRAMDEIHNIALFRLQEL